MVSEHVHEPLVEQDVKLQVEPEQVPPLLIQFCWFCEPAQAPGIDTEVVQVCTPGQVKAEVSSAKAKTPRIRRVDMKIAETKVFIELQDRDICRVRSGGNVQQPQHHSFFRLEAQPDQ